MAAPPRNDGLGDFVLSVEQSAIHANSHGRVEYEFSVYLLEDGIKKVESIESHCKFVEYDENDIEWAEPAGLITVHRRTLRIGDVVNVSEFIRYYDAEAIVTDASAIYQRGHYLYPHEVVYRLTLSAKGNIYGNKITV